MILIADSGSTKTDWRCIDTDQVVTHISTIGFNPVLVDTSLIIKSLKTVFLDKKWNKKIVHIYYYGAGCWDEQSCLVVKNALVHFFPKADIQVTNDLLGAARAVCGMTPGIACILGTGANSCLFDGQKIVDNVPPLGFIMGDEGSGAYLGKQLLKHYFYRELPSDLKKKLDLQKTVSKKKLIKKVYRGKKGNRYLASFAEFIIQEKGHPFMQQLISDAIDQFISRQVLKYKKVDQLPIHFIGSIAYFLKKILKKRLAQYNLQLGKVIRQPIDGLVEFHKQP